MSATIIHEAIHASGLNGKTTSSVEYVRSLTPDEKDEVLIALLEEVLEIQEGQGPIFFDKNGKDLGYWVTPALAKIYHEKTLEGLPPHVVNELNHLKENLLKHEDCLSAEEALALVKAQESQQPR